MTGGWFRGEVVFFKDTGGYGFIETDETDDDVFFHLEDMEIEEDPEEGEVFQFKKVDTDEGPKATEMERGLVCAECDSEKIFLDGEGYICYFCEGRG